MTTNTLRTFIALDLDDGTRQALAQLQAKLKAQIPARAVRWTNLNSIHLTLKFLGDTPADQVPVVAEAVQKAATGFPPFALEIAGLGCFPNPRRARVIWVGVTEIPRALAGVHHAVDLHLSRLGWEREKRAFSPHLTVGRVNNRTSSADRELLATVLATSQVGRLGVVPVNDVILYQSDLRPTGAVYTALAHAPLQG